MWYKHIVGCSVYRDNINTTDSRPTYGPIYRSIKCPILALFSTADKKILLLCYFFSIGKKESVHKVAKRNATKTPLKPRLRISIFQLSWEQAAQDRTKWRCLINKGASQFEAKRNCEAERNGKERKERKASTKGPSSDSAQSEFTCSI